MRLTGWLRTVRRCRSCDIDSGMPIFRGVPAFLAQGGETAGRTLLPSDLCWRPVGRRDWRMGMPSAEFLGTAQVGWKADGGAIRSLETIRMVPAGTD